MERTRYQKNGKAKRKNSEVTEKKASYDLSSTNFIYLDIDPSTIRFAHSRIRPIFSGCGRSLVGTLEEIRTGKTKVTDLPLITVIEGPKENSCNWYFSLNNRRLWVLKSCKDEGLLGSEGLVRVRARGPKVHEIERYTLERCSNVASFIREREVTSQEI